MGSSIYTKMAHDSYFRMGYLHQLEGDLRSAAECYIRSIEARPSAEAHTFLGWVLSQMGNIEHAIEECKKAVALDPDFGNAWNDLGAYFTEKREFDQAIPFFEKACKSKNYDTQEYAHYNLARVYLQKEMLVSAQKQLKLAIKKNPGFVPAKTMLANLDSQLH
jgi:Tfp pilus assembly protein PilF